MDRTAYVYIPGLNLSVHDPRSRYDDVVFGDDIPFDLSVYVDPSAAEDGAFDSRAGRDDGGIACAAM